MEVWKDIPNYEGMYQVSNYGRVKSLSRLNGRGFLLKEKTLIATPNNNGYMGVLLHKKAVRESIKIHQLVAIVFLNHIQCGHKLVINHKDLNRLNNHIDNLEIVTNRENCDRKHLPSSSKYVGVGLHKASNKWRCRILINGKRKSLGYYVNEYDAHLAYEKALSEL